MRLEEVDPHFFVQFREVYLEEGHGRRDQRDAGHDNVLTHAVVRVRFELYAETADGEFHFLRADISRPNLEYLGRREELFRKAIIGEEEIQNAGYVPVGNLRENAEGGDGRSIQAGQNIPNNLGFVGQPEVSKVRKPHDALGWKPAVASDLDSLE